MEKNNFNFKVFKKEKDLPVKTPIDVVSVGPDSMEYYVDPKNIDTTEPPKGQLVDSGFLRDPMSFKRKNPIVYESKILNKRKNFEAKKREKPWKDGNDFEHLSSHH